MSPEEAAAYRRQAEREMENEIAAIRVDVDQEMQRFAREQGIQMDDTDTDTDEDDTNISRKEFLELMKNIRIRLAGPLPGEPNPNYLKKGPPDNNEDQGHAYPVSVPVHGGKKNKKKRRRKTKRKRKKKKRKTKRRR